MTRQHVGDWQTPRYHTPKQLCMLRRQHHAPLLPKVLDLGSGEAFQGWVAAAQVPEEPGADLLGAQ